MSLEPGVYASISNEQYHSSGAISKTGLDLIHRSPAHYKAAREGARVETKAMHVGSAAHCAILEPDEFPKRYAFGPEGIDRRTKAGKTAWAEFLQTVGDRAILAGQDYELCLALAAAVRAHPAACKLLHAKDRLFEHTIIARDPETGVIAQCRPDLWLREQAIMVDLKTTEDASPEGFGKSVANYRYHVSAAWYPDVLSWATGEATRAFVFIAVEKQPPYAVGVYYATFEDITQGWHEYREDLAVYADCLRHDVWPAYSDKIEPLQMPRWAKRQQNLEPRTY